MTAKAPRTCDVCRLDGGWHFTEDGEASRCPNWHVAEQHENALALAAAAHEKAYEAAKELLRDFAAQAVEFSANDTRDIFDHAQIPDSVSGAVYQWASSKASGPLLESTGRMVMSTESSTRHKITVWRSLVFRGRAA